jgi:TRAP-type uncharacterized transport system substrate-binding protein
MLRITVAAAVLAFVQWSSVAPAHSQAIPKYVEEGGPEAEIKARKNAWTVGVAGGLMEGTFLRFAAEMAKALDDGDNLRVIPMVTFGAASNLDDLLYLRGVDVALTQSDVFEYFRTERKTPGLQNRVHYIIRFYSSEVHVLARPEITSLQDLQGKKVNFNTPGSAANLTGPIVFQRLGIKVDQLLLNNSIALEKMKTGEISALVHVVGKPNDLFTKIPPDSGFHFLPVPFSEPLRDIYALGVISDKEYPNLVPPGQTVDTVTVPVVLAVYNWPKGSDRYRRVERFVEAMFTKWDKFLEPPFHPKWREMNLAATVPGWTRFSVSERMLERMATGGAGEPQLRRDFEAFVGGQAGPGVRLSDAEREALFREFLAWRGNLGNRAR